MASSTPTKPALGDTFTRLRLGAVPLYSDLALYFALCLMNRQGLPREPRSHTDHSPTAGHGAHNAHYTI